MFVYSRPLLSLATTLVLAMTASLSLAETKESAEAAVRALVRANAEKDIVTMSQLTAHDDDITSYTIGGRKYIGWADLERGMLEKVSTAASPELPSESLRSAALPLRQTGVPERRNRQRVLLSWQESFRNASAAVTLDDRTSRQVATSLVSDPSNRSLMDLSGEWDILEVEDDKRYKATLDKAGNGPYTQHGGRFVTTKFSERLWQGTWHQPGNDREGGFEVLLSEDGKEAKGVWWYTRVGTHKNIPPREHGGTYYWKRLTPVPMAP